jgi:hypothetical protein
MALLRWACAFDHALILERPAPPHHGDRCPSAARWSTHARCLLLAARVDPEDQPADAVKGPTAWIALRGRARQQAWLTSSNSIGQLLRTPEMSPPRTGPYRARRGPEGRTDHRRGHGIGVEDDRRDRRSTRRCDNRDGFPRAQGNALDAAGQPSPAPSSITPTGRPSSSIAEATALKCTDRSSPEGTMPSPTVVTVAAPSARPRSSHRCARVVADPGLVKRRLDSGIDPERVDAAGRHADDEHLGHGSKD